MGRQMVRHQVTGSSGFDSHPEIFLIIKKFRGWGLDWSLYIPSIRREKLC
ncbi:hypothetical protein EMIT0210MI2_30133 [Priestia megaterium]